MEERIEWIKILFAGTQIVPVGLYPCIHGRIETLPGISLPEDEELHTYEDLEQAINGTDSFELYDPILLNPQPTPEGQIAMGATALCKSSMPAMTRNCIMIKPQTISIWSPIVNDMEWRSLVSQTIHGIELATGIPDDYQGPSVLDI